ncbi:SIMPL domain-containing protein [Spongiivirga sp. MCCC 1A20706]|uniref:SIMPL domain-containing protein n=1 Tax=Spongiivirga sp. MCCC 1A20706 TaxID=3160963 RepID=UPI0039779BF6
MRTILLFISLMACASMTAQERNSIHLIERMRYVDPNPSFKASVVVSSYYANYNNNSVNTAELISQFEEKLIKNDINPEDLEKDETGYISLALGKEGMLYHYKTTSQKKLFKLISINTLGSSRLNYDYIAKLSPTAEGNLIKKAVEKARIRAQEMASTFDKKVGGVIKLQTNYDGGDWIRGIFRDTVIGEMVIDVQVDFELLE